MRSRRPAERRDDCLCRLVSRLHEVGTALREAAPFALLVTHGFGVQAMAEVATNEGMEEPSYCSATRMRKLGDADWSCDLVCRADHLAGAAPKRNGNGPMHTIAFSSSAF
mgnify:CR=1 FL=1